MRLAGILICAAIATFSAFSLTSQGNAEPFTSEVYISQSPLGDIVDAIGQVSEAAQDKVLASQELADARAAFYRQLDQGILGSPEEQAFGDLLRAKDLYFLSMTVTEGVFASAERNNAINTLTGIFTGSTSLDQPAEHSPLDLVGGQALADADMDDGITQKGAFSDWVNAVRGALGAAGEGQVVFVFDPVTYQAAIDASAEAYDYYRTRRDKAEFERWRGQRTPVVGPPLNDPGQRVDAYLTATRFKLEGEGVSPVVIEDWLPRLRDVLLAGENVEITPEVIVRYMEDKEFTSEDIEFWKTTYEDFKKQANYSPIWTPLDALCETHVMRDERLYGQSTSCSDASYVISIKDWLNQPLKEQRNKLFLEVGLRDVADYDVASLAMQDGRFAYEPPLPTFRQYDAALPTPTVPVK